LLLLARTGRPKKEISWPTLDGLCKIQCTEKEIADVLGICVETLNRAVKAEKKMTFAEYYARASQDGKTSIRRMQYKLAMEGDRTMLIFLGKNYLGQSDNPQRSDLDREKFKHDTEIDNLKYW
jgi:hypothetical protein